MNPRFRKAQRVFTAHHGTLRTVEAQCAGIHPRTLYALRDAGEIEQVARGLYRLTTLPAAGEPDLLTVAKKVPRAVFCLLTALAFHRLTTQTPHAVAIALPRTARIPRLNHPPLEVFRFSSASLHSGVHEHEVDGAPIRLYSPEKTLADMFKYRHKLGLDVAVEALRTYRGRRKGQDLGTGARLCAGLPGGKRHVPLPGGRGLKLTVVKLGELGPPQEGSLRRVAGSGARRGSARGCWGMASPPPPLRAAARRSSSIRVGLGEPYAESAAKAVQWQAFVRRGRFSEPMFHFAEVVGAVTGFLQPVCAALVT